MIRTPDLLVRSHCRARDHGLAALPTFTHERAFSITSTARRVSLTSAAMQGVGILLGIPPDLYKTDEMFGKWPMLGSWPRVTIRIGAAHIVGTGTGSGARRVGSAGTYLGGDRRASFTARRLRSTGSRPFCGNKKGFEPR